VNGIDSMLMVDSDPAVKPGVVTQVNVRPLVAPKRRRIVDLAGAISALALSPDGRYLALARLGQVILVHMESGRWEWFWPHGNRSDVRSLRFSSDGQHVILGLAGGRIMVWNLNGARVVNMVAPKGGLYAATIGPDGRLLALVEDEEDRRLMRVWAGQPGGDRWEGPLLTYRVKGEYVHDATVTPRGEVVIVDATGEVVLLHPASGGRRVVRPAGSPPPRLYHLDGLMAVATNVLSLLCLDDGREVYRSWHGRSPMAAALNPTGASVFLAFAEEGGVVYEYPVLDSGPTPSYLAFREGGTEAFLVRAGGPEQAAAAVFLETGEFPHTVSPA